MATLQSALLTPDRTESQRTAAPAAVKPTQEQQDIIDFSLTGESFSVRAKAGTGKTSTLKSIAEANPTKKMLYLAFNNSIAREARTKFPSNVEVKTGHALAYPFIGKSLNEQGRLVTSDFAIRTAIIESFAPQLETIGGKRRDELNESAFTVYDTVKAFMNSKADRIGIEHVPEDQRKAVPDRIIKTAQAVFSAMIDVESGSKFPASHDAYLKAYTLTHPKLTQYQAVLGDEWQDTNRNMQNLLDEQTHAQLIYVGDSSQAIYGFRGAVDALSELDDLPKFDLTQSFRFGPHVAEIANAILAVKGEEIKVKGFAAIDDHVLPVRMPDVVLARTNAGLFHEAFATIPRLGDGERIAFVGGVREVLTMVTAAYDLYDKGETKHRDFKYFKTWDDLAKVVEDGHAAEYAPFVRLIEDYGGEIPEMCQQLAAASVESESDARVVFSTAHKFKGREAEAVRIASDFPEICKYDEARHKFTLNVEEANLAYVAITRAQLVLDASAYVPVLMQSLENRQFMLEGQLAYGESEGKWTPARRELQGSSIAEIEAARVAVNDVFEAEESTLREVATKRALAAADGLEEPPGVLHDRSTKIGAIVADALGGPYREIMVEAESAAREPRFLASTFPSVVVDKIGNSYPTIAHALDAMESSDAAMRGERSSAIEASMVTDFVQQKFSDASLAKKLLVLADEQITDYAKRHPEPEFELGASRGVDLAEILIAVRNDIQQRIIDGLLPETERGGQISIDVTRLASRIEETDWEAGPTATRGTLGDIAAAAMIDPIKTSTLIERFAQENGADKDPDIAGIIGELRGALKHGLDLGVDPIFGRTPVDALPVFEPKPTDIVSDRSLKKLVMNQEMTVESQSPDGEVIFGRGKGNVIVAVGREAFADRPQAGAVVSVKRVNGFDIAEPVTRNRALEIAG